MNFFLSGFRDCPGCGMRAVKNNFLCELCEKVLTKKIKDERTENCYREGRSHRWLLNWKSDDPLLTALVRNIKGCRNEVYFHKLALLFLSGLRIPKDLIRPTLIYPSKGTKDHGWAWAMALSHYLGCSAHPLRTVSGAGSKQSLKSRAQRQRIRFEPRSCPSSVVFVDDIYTSGGTAKAAFQALGRPQNLEIWTIFYRPRL